MLVGVYFAASACVCAVCVVLYACILPTLPFVQYHRKKSRASLQPYRMAPVASRSAVHHLDSRASSVSKQRDDTQPGDQEVCAKYMNCMLIGSKVGAGYGFFNGAQAYKCLVCLQHCIWRVMFNAKQA